MFLQSSKNHQIKKDYQTINTLNKHLKVYFYYKKINNTLFDYLNALD